MTGNKIRRATAIVEFALIAPLLFLILFAIIEFGWYFMCRQVIHHTTEEIARTATLPGFEDTQDQGIHDVILKNKARDMLEGIVHDTSLVYFDRDAAVDLTDSDEKITIKVPVGAVALPGFVLCSFMDCGTDDKGDKIAFTVVRPHQRFTRAPGAAGS